MSHASNFLTAAQKPKIAIISIYPFDRGGVLSILKVAYKFCEKHFEPKLFFLGFDIEISANLRALKFSSEARYGNKYNMNYVELGARWAFWHPGHYKNTLSWWKHLLNGYDYFFVVSGTIFPAHPLVLLNKKFVLWAASTYEEDRKHRIQEELVGIRYFIDKLTHPKMLHIEKTILHKANFILPLSNYTKKLFTNIIGYEKFSMETTGFPINVPSRVIPYNKREGNILIAVGRFDDPRKNVDMLFRVFDKINTTFPDTKLYIIGNQPSHNKIKTYSKLPSFKNIRISGKIKEDELDNLYQQASLMLFTSFQEGLGIVCLEAFSRGIPVVATNSGGPADYIKNGKTGYIVEIDDDEMMYQKAVRILQNKNIASFMSRNCQNLVREIFSEKKVHDTFIKAFSNTYPELKIKFVEYAAKEKLEKDFFTNIRN